MTNSSTYPAHTAARVALFAGIAALSALLLLHVFSPELDPARRMISEYALGNSEWLLALFFFCWAGASFGLAIALWPQAKTIWAKIAILLLVISGIGEAMGGMFDLRHPLHGMAFLLGVPTLPVAAMLLSVHLARKPSWFGHRRLLLWSANLTWISIGLMAIAMAVMMSSMAKAGITIPSEPSVTMPPMPSEVFTSVGWPNRFMVTAYCGWLIITARAVLRITERGSS